MLHFIEDETGQRWAVGKDDPAYTLVQKLHTRHYTWVVLPRSCIISGKLTGPTLKECLKTARQIGYNTTEGKRYLRLAECLKVLGE